MKKNIRPFLAVAYIGVASQLISCSYEPVRTEEPVTHSPFASSRYRPNEVIVMFKSPPTAAALSKINDNIQAAGIDPATIDKRKCNSCNAYVELWQAPNLHSTIHAEGIGGGTVTPRGTNGVGEDGYAYYSLNFIQDIPLDSLPNITDFNYDLKKVENDTTGKEVIRIAVLDTGIDTDRIISPSYRWTNQAEASPEAKPLGDDDNNCFEDDLFGWNFISDSNNVEDDNPGLHGTLVSHYIINEFANSQSRALQLMTLKTHDKDGRGDLFSSICAIHYAMEKGANIINASWGFYYYQDNPHPYLDNLITSMLRENGILFVAAAGNKIEKMDKFARDAYAATHNGVIVPDSYLRDLACHNFYPACLSKIDNNVVTVTTADKTRVSLTQNYSNRYVDMGAIPDDINLMRFIVPFHGPVTTISGSSFATPIVTGRIGAFLPKASYQPNIDKSVVLEQMEAASLSTRSSLLESMHIRKGRITEHN